MHIADSEYINILLRLEMSSGVHWKLLAKVNDPLQGY